MRNKVKFYGLTGNLGNSMALCLVVGAILSIVLLRVILGWFYRKIVFWIFIVRFVNHLHREVKTFTF